MKPKWNQRWNGLIHIYDSVSLKVLTVIVYFVEVMAAIVMFTFVAYEKGGYAGQYRTLINQLLSCLYGGVS